MQVVKVELTTSLLQKMLINFKGKKSFKFYYT